MSGMPERAPVSTNHSMDAKRSSLHPEPLQERPGHVRGSGANPSEATSLVSQMGRDREGSLTDRRREERPRTSSREGKFMGSLRNRKMESFQGTAMAGAPFLYSMRCRRQAGSEGKRSQKETDLLTGRRACEWRSRGGGKGSRCPGSSSRQPGKAGRPVFRSFAKWLLNTAIVKI